LEQIADVLVILAIGGGDERVVEGKIEFSRSRRIKGKVNNISWGAPANRGDYLLMQGVERESGAHISISKK
jgi:hypothetical protein